MDLAVEGAIGEVSRGVGNVGPAERFIASPEQVLGGSLRVRGGPAQRALEECPKSDLAQDEGDAREQGGHKQRKEARRALASHRAAALESTERGKSATLA